MFNAATAMLEIAVKNKIGIRGALAICISQKNGRIQIKINT
jgi:hypothetical protein